MEAKSTNHVRLDPQPQPHMALPVLQVGLPSQPSSVLADACPLLRRAPSEQEHTMPMPFFMHPAGGACR